MGDFEFDAALRLSGDAPAFGAELTGDWNTLAGVNGGIMLSLLTGAMERVAPFPDPVVVSGFYLRPGSPGPAVIETDLIRSGRTTAFAQASLLREGKETRGKEILRATAAFSDLGTAAGPLFTGGSAPALPPPDECAAFTHGFPGVTIADRVEYRYVEIPGFFRGEPSGNPVAEFYTRFRDGREPDLLSLPLFVDAAPPVSLEVGVPATTTVELTVHLRARPAPGWLSCRVTTRYVAGGYHEEDCEIWDSAGTLVAQSRQFMLILGQRRR